MPTCSLYVCACNVVSSHGSRIPLWQVLLRTHSAQPESLRFVASACLRCSFWRLCIVLCYESRHPQPEASNPFGSGKASSNPFGTTSASSSAGTTGSCRESNSASHRPPALVFHVHIRCTGNPFGRSTDPVTSEDDASHPGERANPFGASARSNPFQQVTALEWTWTVSVCCSRLC